MSSKLALHLQAHPNWADDDGSDARWIKVMDPPADNRWPGKLAIGRVYMPDDESNRLVAHGAAGAEEWFRFCQPAFARAPWVHCWEGPNEPQPVADLGFCQALAAWTERWAALMRAAGLRTVGGNLSEGNPGGDEAQRRACFQAIARGLAHCDYWGQHAYWVLGYSHPEAGMNDWHAFRYRLNVRYAAEAGITLPPLLLTECGVDGGVVAMPKRGWKTFCRSRQHYLEQLAMFDAELAKDDYVLAATVFTAGPMGWEDFEVDRELNDMINAHIHTQGGSYAPAAPPTLGDLLRLEFGADFEDLSRSLPRHATLTYQQRALPAIDRIVLHHTEADRSISWQAVARYHVQSQGWPGIGYHIGLRQATRGGRVTISLLNEPHVRSYHAHSVGNNSGLAVCLAGKFDQAAPTPEDAAALRRVVAALRRWATWSELAVVGHKEVPGNQTSCPGAHLAALLPSLNAAPLSTLLRAEADRRQVLQLNPNASLQQRMVADGYVPTSPEFELDNAGTVYVAQRAERLDTGHVRVYYVQRGQWSEVHWC